MPSSANQARSPLHLYEEREDPREADLFRRFVEHDSSYHRKDYPETKRPARRRLHVKSHGCVHATFRIDSGVPAQLRHGLFAEPKEFPAIVRFSNGLRLAQSDQERDARGMAIKLFTVPGKKVLDDEPDATTHDFTLLNAPRFFVRDPFDFAEFSRAVDETGNPIRFLFGLNPFRWKLRETLALVQATRMIDNPLAERYFSQSAFRLGPLAVKYHARPLNTELCRPPAGPNSLRAAMIEQLGSGSIDFEFGVQVQCDPVAMPIEDTLTAWSEELAPFQRVATLHIPAQRFATSERDAYCEHLSFTAWHCLPEHRPLGGINRMRLHAYRASQQLRHQLNGVPRREPDSIEDFMATAGR